MFFVAIVPKISSDKDIFVTTDIQEEQKADSYPKDLIMQLNREINRNECIGVLPSLDFVLNIQCSDYIPQ